MSVTVSMNYPKAINCRLGEQDTDIKLDLLNCADKTARTKELYRLGLLYENLQKRRLDPKSYTFRGESAVFHPLTGK